MNFTYISGIAREKGGRTRQLSDVPLSLRNVIATELNKATVAFSHCMQGNRPLPLLLERECVLETHRINNLRFSYALENGDNVVATVDTPKFQLIFHSRED